MQIVRDLGGYSYGRSDLVRRAMSKKKHKVMMEEKEYFINGKLDENGNLTPYAQEFTRLEVVEEIVVGNTRTTLCRGTAERGTDDVWRVTLPYDKLNGAETFTVNLYVTTAAGRIRVDAGYLCDRRAGTLTRLSSAGETEGTS